MDFYSMIAAGAGSILGVLIRMATINYCTITLLTIQLPVATLAVNALGSCIAGFFINKLSCQSNAFTFIIIGLCGSMTTMSTCALESLLLCNAGNYWMGMINALTNIIISIGAAALGLSISSFLHN